MTSTAQHLEKDKCTKKILIIDDDRAVAIGMFMHLKAHGYEVITAYDAIAGLRLCLEHVPDLVILDVCLPAASGFDVAAKIRDMPPMAGTPIIFMTGSRAPKFPGQAAELRAAAFLEKPFDDGRMIAAVRQALGDTAPAMGPAAPENAEVGTRNGEAKRRVLRPMADPSLRKWVHQLVLSSPSTDGDEKGSWSKGNPCGGGVAEVAR